MALDGLKIANGLVEGNGGGIYNEGNLHFKNTTLDNNQANKINISTPFGSVAREGHGGALHNEGGIVNITDSVFSNNRAEDSGGAIRTDLGSITISNSTLANNYAGDKGGAIHNKEGKIDIDASAFLENESEDDGGAINNQEGSTTVINSTIYGNKTNNYGGGIRNFTHGSATTLTVINSTIANNIADSDNSGDGDGGGIYEGSITTVDVSNTIVAGNFDPSVNSILGNKYPDVWGNFNSNGGNLIGDLTGSTGFNTATGTDLSFASLGGIAIADVLAATPALNGATAGTPLTLALAPGSPAIDAGNNSLATTLTDQRGAGFNRIEGNQVDIGAYETQIDLVISEIMYAPASSQPIWEWLEVYNAGSATIDLTNFVLDDDDGTAIAAPNIAAGSIAPGQTAILYNADLAQANFTEAWDAGINLVPVTNWPELDDSDDDVALWPSFSSYQIGFGAAEDRVNYNSSGSWPVSNNAASIYLTNLSANNNNGSNWALSAIGNSSPTSKAYESAIALLGNSGLDIGSPGSTDSAAPTSAITVANITTEGGANHKFTVRYEDNRAIDASTLDNSDIIVVSPNGSNISATLKQTDPTGNNSAIEATYQINAPGSSWDFADNGNYTVKLQANEITDTTGNSVTAGTLGIFQVAIDTASPPPASPPPASPPSASPPPASAPSAAEQNNNSANSGNSTERSPLSPTEQTNPATAAENPVHASDLPAVTSANSSGDGNNATVPFEPNSPSSLETPPENSNENSNNIGEVLTDIGIPEATAREAASQLATEDTTILENLEPSQVAQIAETIQERGLAIEEFEAEEVVEFIANFGGYLALPPELLSQLPTEVPEDLQDSEAIAIVSQLLENGDREAILDPDNPLAAVGEIVQQLENGNVNLTPDQLNGVVEICNQLADPNFAANFANSFAAPGSAENSRYGDDRDNTLIGNNDNNGLYGLGGSDTLLGHAGADTVLGGEGSNLVGNLPALRSEQDLIFGNQGNDLLGGNEGADTIYSGQDNDLAFGGKQDDRIWGDRGSDTLLGNLGSDTIFGGSSNPETDDSTGSDLLLGGSGNDFLNGNQSNDTLAGGEGNDTLRGGQNDDLLCGHSGSDILWGDLGSDTLSGGEGDDTLQGAIGSSAAPESEGDWLFGGAGNDFMNGNEGQDLVNGGDGEDTLYGGQNSDTLIGGSGNDLLVGDRGDDLLAGGVGSDIFVLSATSGLDTVLDFQDGQDLFLLSDSLTFDDLTISALDSATLIALKTTQQPLLLVNGVDAGSIDFEDFKI